jgi:uncharacterized protein YdaU (DUF1376 family)
MHYFKRNIGEYHKKAGKLSMLEHGAYTLLMDACYDREKFPTLEEAIDWCWARTPDEIAAVEFVLRKFFTLEDSVYVQNRIREEIDQYHSNALINKEIALKREEARRNKKARTVLEPCTNEHEPPPKQETRTRKQEPENKNQELNIIAPQAAQPATPAKKRKGTRLPDDWRPTQEFVDAAMALNPDYTREWFRSTAHKFRDYWIAKTGRDSTKADWLATWRNWIRNDLEYNRGKNHAAAKQLDNDSTDWVDRVFGTPASGDPGKQDFSFIEGDFSSVGSGDTGSGLPEPI